MMLFAAGWCGYNEQERKFEMVTISEDHEGDYAAEARYAGFDRHPECAPSYVPAHFNGMAPELRAVAALRAIRRFTEEHGAEFGMPPIGGEIILTDLRPDGVSSKVVAPLR